MSSSQRNQNLRCGTNNGSGHGTGVIYGTFNLDEYVTAGELGRCFLSSIWIELRLNPDQIP